MDLYQLRIFFTLCKVQSYTKAAQALHVTQSAVSHAIRKLQASVETPLIHKKGKQFELTSAGRDMYRSCELIFYEIDKVEESLKRYSQNQAWHICLGSPVEFGTTILLRHIQEFLQAEPRIHLDFLFSNSLREPLVRDEVDFIIDCRDHFLPNTEAIFLFREQYVAICSPDYLKECVLRSIRDLKEATILSMDKDAVWWKNFQTTLPPDSRIIFKHVVRINHVRGIINGAIHGLGVGFVPKYTVIRELNEKILVNPFPEIKPAADHFNIFIKTPKLKLEKNRALIDFLTHIEPVEFGSETG